MALIISIQIQIMGTSNLVKELQVEAQIAILVAYQNMRIPANSVTANSTKPTWIAKTQTTTIRTGQVAKTRITRTLHPK